MNPHSDELTSQLSRNIARVNRRQLFGSTAGGIGMAALASLLKRDCQGAEPAPQANRGSPGLPELPHHPPKARRVVLLWQGGGPSHVDLFDDKPMLREMAGKDIPDTIRGNTRL
ncbi:MAG: DUF1501 domain-containing protein, partial [Planctomycetaceae bacterium]